MIHSPDTVARAKSYGVRPEELDTAALHRLADVRLRDDLRQPGCRRKVAYERNRQLHALADMVERERKGAA